MITLNNVLSTVQLIILIIVKENVYKIVLLEIFLIQITSVKYVHFNVQLVYHQTITIVNLVTLGTFYMVHNVHLHVQLVYIKILVLDPVLFNVHLKCILFKNKVYVHLNALMGNYKIP